MITFRGEAASTEISSDGRRFSPVALEQMAAQINNGSIPINNNFDWEDVIGCACSAEVVGGKLVVTGKINSTARAFWAVPGYRINPSQSADSLIDDSVDLFCLGATSTPADSTIQCATILEAD